MIHNKIPFSEPSAYADGCSNDDHRYKESSRSTHGTDKSVYGTNNSAHGQGGGRHDYFRPAFGGESHPPHHHVTPSIPLMGRPPEPHQNQRRSSRGGGQIHGHQSEEHYHHRSNYEEGHLTQSAPYSSTAASAVYSKRAQNGGEAMAPPPWAVTSEAQAGLNGTSAAEMERRITEEDRQWMAVIYGGNCGFCNVFTVSTKLSLYKDTLRGVSSQTKPPWCFVMVSSYSQPIHCRCTAKAFTCQEAVVFSPCLSAPSREWNYLWVILLTASASLRQTSELDSRSTLSRLPLTFGFIFSHLLLIFLCLPTPPSGHAR